MSDLSIFKIDNQTINIKDTTARQAAESAKTLATTASGNATTALNKANKLESEKADKTLATTSANGLMSAADKKAIDREFFRMLPKGGTYIPANADLNSIEYLKVGNYYNSVSAQSGTIKNIPYNRAFIMYVLSPLSEVYDNESTAHWVYRLRIFITHTGGEIFVQNVFSDTTAGSFTYGPWVKMTNSNDLGAVSKIINDHIANKSNPHAVTKAQVGLGSVANLDQSKAIKSITRNGTTFTATALDGTKTTFTQQDNNTTYSAASASSDGLMSKTDKAKLDGIGAGSNVKSVNGKTGAVTLVKGDVGLGSVANIDQSKAIKSITRSGTTFTATALDGTKTTFTQQDSNTTYSVATTSADGLMSAADKTKLDAALNKINKLEKLSRVSISYDSTKENMTITIGTHSVA